VLVEGKDLSVERVEGHGVGMAASAASTMRRGRMRRGSNAAAAQRLARDCSA